MSVDVVNEITRAERWLFTQLSSDATITGIVGARIYAGVMPQEVQTYPALVYQFQSARDDLDAGGPFRIWSRPIYLVKGITKSRSALPLQTLMDRVDVVLFGARGGVTGAAVDSAKRLRPMRLTTIENNETFQHVGAEWELALRAQA